jgi:tRNA(Ile)-lysidine synthase
MNLPEVQRRVRSFMESKGLAAAGDSLLLSVSAGKDSMAMLHILSGMAVDLEITLSLFHLNHMVRGTESEEDEAFLRDLAETMGLRLHVERYDFGTQRATGVSFEEHARVVRYRLLEEIAGREGYTSIATAHTRSDDIETMLMRLFTGTGIHGLTGIPARRGIIIRPILCLGSDDVRAYLEELGIPWRDDSTNSDPAFTRNYIRRELVPRIAAAFPGYEESMTGTKSVAAETLSLLDSMIEDHCGIELRGAGRSFEAEAAVLCADRSLFCHVISTVLRNRFGQFPSRRRLDETWRRASTMKSNLLLYENGGVAIRKSYRRGRSLIVMERPRTPSASARWEHRVQLGPTGNTTVRLQELGMVVALSLGDYASFPKEHRDGKIVFIQIGDENEEITIRNRRNGDRIVLESGTKKIKDFFIEKKLDNDVKDCVPLLIVDDEIAAIMPGFLCNMTNRVSRLFSVRDNSKKVLAIAVENHYTMNTDTTLP